MTAACKLCKALVFGAPTPVLGEERDAAEFLELSEAMRQHIYTQHREMLQAYGGLVDMAVKYLSTLFGESGQAEFGEQQKAMLDCLIDQLRAASVVVVLGEPAAAMSGSGLP